SPVPVLHPVLRAVSDGRGIRLRAGASFRWTHLEEEVRRERPAASVAALYERHHDDLRRYPVRRMVRAHTRASPRLAHLHDGRRRTPLPGTDLEPERRDGHRVPAVPLARAWYHTLVIWHVPRGVSQMGARGTRRGVLDGLHA